jgi:hypothetical protein
MNNFLCRFLKDIGVKRHNRTFEELGIVTTMPGYVVEFDMDDLKEIIQYIANTEIKEENYIMWDLYHKFYIPYDDYRMEAFKLFLLIARYTEDGLEYKDDDLSSIAYKQILQLIKER